MSRVAKIISVGTSAELPAEERGPAERSWEAAVLSDRAATENHRTAVAQGTKAVQVRSMFSAIAPTYDLLNTTLSLGVDSWWRKQAVTAAFEGLTPTAPKLTTPDLRVLDVATGTGKLALALKRRRPAAIVTGVDFAEPMLAVARSTASRAGIDVRFEQGDGTALAFDDSSFDLLTIAYGLRNFADPDAGLREFRRVLRPGGRLVILEFPPPSDGAFGRLFTTYFERVMPRIGAVVSGQRDAYAYLPRSVRGFMQPEELKEHLLAAGFGPVDQRLQSYGISALHVAEVPMISAPEVPLTTGSKRSVKGG